jgi:hypothetical protein
MKAKKMMKMAHHMHFSSLLEWKPKRSSLQKKCGVTGVPKEARARSIIKAG